MVALNEKRYLSANEYLRDIWRLAAKVRKSVERPDVLVALWRGGAPVGLAVHEYFKASGWDVRAVPVVCSSYSGVGENAGKVVFADGEDAFAFLRKGDRVLVVDDVFDTGKTAAAVSERILRAGAEVRTACVYWKPEKNVTNIVPDFYVRDIGLEWLVFPHEIGGLSCAEIVEKDPELADLLSFASHSS